LGTLDDNISYFGSTEPQLDSKYKDPSAQVIARLDEFVGWGVPDDLLDGQIRRGRWGVVGICVWVSKFIACHNVGSDILEPRLSRFIKAMKRL
jgi:hypothetical protein